MIARSSAAVLQLRTVLIKSLSPVPVKAVLMFSSVTCVVLPKSPVMMAPAALSVSEPNTTSLLKLLLQRLRFARLVR